MLLCLKSGATILLTPGFSQVNSGNAKNRKPFKRFQPNLDFRGTWLKPGVNEAKRAECRKLGFLSQSESCCLRIMQTLLCQTIRSAICRHAFGFSSTKDVEQGVVNRIDLGRGL